MAPRQFQRLDMCHCCFGDIPTNLKFLYGNVSLNYMYQEA